MKKNVNVFKNNVNFFGFDFIFISIDLKKKKTIAKGTRTAT